VAEVEGTATLASDDRYRGRSVSQGRPTAGLDLTFNADSGLYAGAALNVVAARHEGLRVLSVQEYAGFAKPLPAGPSLDFGVTHTDYSEYYSGQSPTHYSELFAGVITSRFASHLYFSPNYFGSGAHTLYGEVDTAVRPARNLRLSLHGGLLSYLSYRPLGRRPVQYDGRVGLTTTVRGFEVEVAGTVAGPDPDLYGREPHGRAGVLVALRRRF
jgi:uncharacterized protein (TIGR02001 family)